MSFSLANGGMPASLYGYNPYSYGGSPYYPYSANGFGYNALSSWMPQNYFGSFGSTPNMGGFSSFDSLDSMSGSGALNQMYSLLMMMNYIRAMQTQTTNPAVQTVGNQPATVVNNNVVRPATTQTVATQPTTIKTATGATTQTATPTSGTTTTAATTNNAAIPANTTINGGNVTLGRDLLVKVAQNPAQANTLVRQELAKLAGSDKGWKLVNLFRANNPTTHAHGGKEDKLLDQMISTLAQAAVNQSKGIV